MRTSALLLSGGASTRFGGAPKALAPVGNRSAIRRMVDLSLDRGYDPVVVVVGPHRGPIAHELRELRVDLVDSERWFEGRTASIQAGLEAIPDGCDVLFWPVDHPFVSPRTLERLEAAADGDALGLWFLPTFEDRGGHPVLWKEDVLPKVLELRTDAPLRSLVPELGPQVRRLAVDDPGVIAAIDTPEAYRTAYDAWRARGEE